jgi:hypothetical protein
MIHLSLFLRAYILRSEATRSECKGKHWAVQ